MSVVASSSPKGTKRCSKLGCSRFLSSRDPHAVCESCRPRSCGRALPCGECHRLSKAEWVEWEKVVASRAAAKEKAPSKKSKVSKGSVVPRDTSPDGIPVPVEVAPAAASTGTGEPVVEAETPRTKSRVDSLASDLASFRDEMRSMLSTVFGVVEGSKAPPKARTTLVTDGPLPTGVEADLLLLSPTIASRATGPPVRDGVSTGFPTGVDETLTACAGGTVDLRVTGPSVNTHGGSEPQLTGTGSRTAPPPAVDPHGSVSVIQADVHWDAITPMDTEEPSGPSVELGAVRLPNQPSDQQSYGPSRGAGGSAVNPGRPFVAVQVPTLYSQLGNNNPLLPPVGSGGPQDIITVPVSGFSGGVCRAYPATSTTTTASTAYTGATAPCATTSSVTPLPYSYVQDQLSTKGPATASLLRGLQQTGSGVKPSVTASYPPGLGFPHSVPVGSQDAVGSDTERERALALLFPNGVPPGLDQHLVVEPDYGQEFKHTGKTELDQFIPLPLLQQDVKERYPDYQVEASTDKKGSRPVSLGLANFQGLKAQRESN